MGVTETALSVLRIKGVRACWLSFVSVPDEEKGQCYLTRESTLGENCFLRSCEGGGHFLQWPIQGGRGTFFRVQVYERVGKSLILFLVSHCNSNNVLCH